MRHRAPTQRAKATRASTRPVRVSTTTTRSGPPPCNCTATRSCAADAPTMRVPIGSSSVVGPAAAEPPDARRHLAALMVVAHAVGDQPGRF